MGAAEASLSEANTKDNRHAGIWAWLAVMCLRSEPPREAEAAAAAEQALQLGIDGSAWEDGAEVLLAAGEAYESLGNSRLGEGLFRRALVNAPRRPRVVLGLCRCLSAMGQHEAAEGELRQLMDAGGLSEAEEESASALLATSRGAQGK
jgi:tetratricopeptide (TPR) repeat protein